MSLELSLSLLKQAQPAAVSTAKFVAVDLSEKNIENTLIAKLSKEGFNCDIPTLVLWEGATYYMTKEVIFKTIKCLADNIFNCKLIFDFVLETEPSTTTANSDEVRGYNKSLEFIKSNSEPWQSKFSKQQLTELLQVYFKSARITTDIEIQKQLNLNSKNYKGLFGYAVVEK